MPALIWPTINEAIQHARRTAVAPLTWNPTDHLLSRFSFGPTRGSRAFVAEHGPHHWYKHQVSLASRLFGYRGNANVAAHGPLLRLSSYDMRKLQIDHGNEYSLAAMDQLTEVTLGLQGWSHAQLYETLVDLFANHLNVPNNNGRLWVTRHAFDRDVIRPHAAGSFTNMLLASAKHPAMLLYLNLAESTKTLVNENYGRELLEMHTVGLNYTQNDVVNCARLLTGRTVFDNYRYLYDESIHATGAVKILGFSAPNHKAIHGEKIGDAFLRYLASHPHTARHLATKFCIRFVSDAPSARLVNAVAKAYLDNGTQILPMVSTILHSTEFWESRGKKIRRPTENILATARILGVRVNDWSKALPTLHWMTASVGNVPLNWPAPNGYPDVATAWRSSGALLQLWRDHLSLASGWSEGLAAPSMTALYGRPPATSGDAIDQLGRWITGAPLSPAHRHALQKFLGEPTSTAMASSSLRWLDKELLSLILDGPHHALR